MTSRIEKRKEKLAALINQIPAAVINGSLGRVNGYKTFCIRCNEAIKKPTITNRDLDQLFKLYETFTTEAEV